MASGFLRLRIALSALVPWWLLIMVQTACSSEFVRDGRGMGSTALGAAAARRAALPELHATTAATGAGIDSSACKLAADQNTYLSSGFGYKLNCAPSTGTLRALMFFVDFPDQPAAASETPESLRAMFLPQAIEWYANASYGRLVLHVEADTSRIYRMPARADSYGWQRGLTSQAHDVYIKDALDAYYHGGGGGGSGIGSSGDKSRLTAANASINGDDGVGAASPAPLFDVLYVVPTTRATTISFSPTYMDDVRTRGSPGTYVARKAVTIGHDAYVTWHYKVINHETGHTMCLPDMYPLPSGPTGRYVGGWDIMGYINGPSPDYFAWDKWRLGWLDDDQIDCVAAAGSTTHVISALEIGEGGGGNSSTSPRTKAVVVRHNATAVLVAEVRSNRSVNSGACAPAGVLLYTVSTVTATGLGPVRVQDSKPGSGGCAGDELNDAPLTAVNATYSVPGWGVRVTVTDSRPDSFTVKVDVDGGP